MADFQADCDALNVLVGRLIALLKGDQFTEESVDLIAEIRAKIAEIRGKLDG